MVEAAALISQLQAEQGTRPEAPTRHRVVKHVLSRMLKPLRGMPLVPSLVVAAVFGSSGGGVHEVPGKIVPEPPQPESPSVPVLGDIPDQGIPDSLLKQTPVEGDGPPMDSLPVTGADIAKMAQG